MGGRKAQTPRVKRLQIRAERTEKVQESEDTPKATIAKLKGKAPLAKQTKTVKTVPTGSQKTISIGSQTTVSTRLSTQSFETGQQKEKLPEILAREAAAVLATLSTSPKKKGK